MNSIPPTNEWSAICVLWRYGEKIQILFFMIDKQKVVCLQLFFVQPDSPFGMYQLYTSQWLCFRIFLLLLQQSSFFHMKLFQLIYKVIFSLDYFSSEGYQYMLWKSLSVYFAFFCASGHWSFIFLIWTRLTKWVFV